MKSEVHSSFVYRIQRKTNKKSHKICIVYVSKNYFVLFKVITITETRVCYDCETNISHLGQLKTGFKWSVEVAIKIIFAMNKIILSLLSTEV